MSTKNRLVFVGTYSETITLGTGEVVRAKGEGIYTLRMNPDTGELTLLKKKPGEPNPSFVVLDKTRRFLYSTNELKYYKGLVSGAASAYTVDPENGQLEIINRQPTFGTDAVHIAIDDNDKFLFVANFMSGSVCVLPRNADGSLEHPSCFLQHTGTGPNPIRQTGPHAHGFELDNVNKRAFVPDLGNDRLFVYNIDFENGHLNANDPFYVQLEAGEGPRHCILTPNRKYLYVINEMGSSIYGYAYDEKTGALKFLQKVSTLPEGYTEHSTCSAIKIMPGTDFLYGSNRGHDSLATYKIDQATGLLALVAIQKTGGSTPRDFEFDPEGNFLVAANQASNNLVVFKMDRKTGMMTEVSRIDGIYTGTCVRIYDMD